MLSIKEESPEIPPLYNASIIKLEPPSEMDLQAETITCNVRIEYFDVDLTPSRPTTLRDLLEDRPCFSGAAPTFSLPCFEDPQDDVDEEEFVIYKKNHLMRKIGRLKPRQRFQKYKRRALMTEEQLQKGSAIFSL